MGKGAGGDADAGTGFSTLVVSLHSQLGASIAAANGSPESFSNENGASRLGVGAADTLDKTALGTMVGSSCAMGTEDATTEGEVGGGNGTAETSSMSTGVESGGPATGGVGTLSKAYTKGELGGASWSGVGGVPRMGYECHGERGRGANHVPLCFVTSSKWSSWPLSTSSLSLESRLLGSGA